MRAFNLKHPLFRVILLQICLAILLSSCGGDTACVLQAVAGGAQHCEESAAGN
jgi:hypothetical protein